MYQHVLMKEKKKTQALNLVWDWDGIFLSSFDNVTKKCEQINHMKDRQKNTKLFIDELNMNQERREISYEGFPIQPTHLPFFPLLSIFHSTLFSYLSWTSFTNTNQLLY